jgi:serine/threonine protein kinase
VADTSSIVGRTISHYAVLEKLGGGGMGVVCKAEDTRLHRFVAVKFLPPDIARDPSLSQRLTIKTRSKSLRRNGNLSQAGTSPLIC